MVGGARSQELAPAEAQTAAAPALGDGGGGGDMAPLGGAIPDLGATPPADPGGAKSASEQAYETPITVSGKDAGKDGGDFVAERVGVDELAGPDQPIGPPQNLEAGKADIAASAQALPELGGAEDLGGIGADKQAAPAATGGGDSGPPSPEVAKSISGAQDETRTAIAQAETESTAFKTEIAARRDRFDAEQHATMIDKLTTMSAADKRSTLREMGYDEKSVKKMKDAELDAIISGRIDKEQRQSRILGMTPEELAKLTPDRKIQHLVDLGIDKADLDKVGQARATKLFDDVMAVAHVPGQHEVKIKIKGGLLGKSWIVKVNCDAEGNTDMAAQKEGGFFSKLWGWVKAALPIICLVLAPLTAGASLIALAVYQASVAIASGDWLGAITAGAGALVGVGAFLAAKGALGAASTFAKVAQVATKVKNVAQAAQTSMLAAKAKNAGSLLGALASGAASFAAFSASSADKFAQTMTRWSERLKKWGGVISGGETVIHGIKSGDPVGAIGGAFDTVGAAADPKSATAKTMMRASTLTGFANAGRAALGSKPPNYGAVAEAALGIAGTLKQDRKLEDSARVVAAANMLKTAWDGKGANPEALAAAAFGVAQAIQVANYDVHHDDPGKDGKDGADATAVKADGSTADADDDRTAYIGKYERAGRVVAAAATAVAAARTKPRPNYTAALAAGTELIADLTENKRIDEAAAITSGLDAWTAAVNSGDQAAILAAGAAFGQAISDMRQSIVDDRAKAKAAAAAKLAAGDTLPDDTVSASDLAYGDDKTDAGKDKTGADPIYKTQKWATDRGFSQLDDNQRRMLDEVAPDGDGATLWSGLPATQRAGFLNVTSVIKANGFGLEGLTLQPLAQGGIQQDRLLFTSDSGARLRAPLQAAIDQRDQRGDRGFLEDKPENNLHPGMADWGGRQWVTQNSMQIGGGSGGVFVDIDEFGPKVDVVGTMGHVFEVLHNKITHKKTDPFKVAQGLDKRGDDP